MMKIKADTRAQMRVIEAIISSFIILSAIAFVNVYTTIPSSTEYETTDLEKMGHNLFHEFNERGELIRFVYGNETEWMEFTHALLLFFPPDIYFNLNIYRLDQNGTLSLVNPDNPIRFGSPELFQESNSAVSVPYIVPGQQSEYNPMILNLQLVRGL